MKTHGLRTTLALLLLSLAGAPRRARAEDAPPREASAAPAPVAAQVAAGATTPGAIHLMVNRGAPDRAALAAAVAAELRRPVEIVDTEAACPLPCMVVSVDRKHDHVCVQYATPAGVLRQRTIGIPVDPRESVDVIALLAGNVVREEAAALVAERRGTTA
ncbi:MAG TPA: hypothetical protein VHE35_13425 [Kofleriaceae bacterium]|nr:hypothetical protein [Kofleriaceae bacterium]